MAQNQPNRVALIGAGAIAEAHVRGVGACRDARVVAVVDPIESAARSLAKGIKSCQAFGSVDELLKAGIADAAHVLVPPPLHARLAEQLLRGGLHVLVEKPLALQSDEIEQLAQLAETQGRTLGVNHNMVFHPEVVRLREQVERRKLGRVEHVNVVHNVPLRQLGTGDVSHFMFQSPGRILLEQAVHPFSILHALLGKVIDAHVTTGPPRTLANGRLFYDTWNIAMQHERGTSHALLAFGRDLIEQTLQVIGTDGGARIDLQHGTYLPVQKTKWLEFFDNAWHGMAGGAGLVKSGIGTAARYPMGLFRITKLPDRFFQGMGGSIADFHAALRSERKPVNNARAAADVVAACEMVAERAGAPLEVTPLPELPKTIPVRRGEVVVTGGTGFVGKHLVPKLLAAGHPVTLLVRRPGVLPQSLRDERIRYVVGDAADRETLQTAIEGATYVIHMATCAGRTATETERVMGEAARTVGEVCKQARVKRLVFISSTAALWLGDRGKAKGMDGPEPKPKTRSDYSKGKVAAERVLTEMSRTAGLPVVILRPAIVVGEGGQPDHGGIGLWVKDNHCVGWGMGQTPLPLVLVEDVADAIRSSLTADGVVGKAFNLAGDVRLTPVEYIHALRRATDRDYHFYPKPVAGIWMTETAKWMVKLAALKFGPLPSMRDFKSRGFFTELDCSDTKEALGWEPVADRDRFFERAFLVHRPAKQLAAGPTSSADTSVDGAQDVEGASAPAPKQKGKKRQKSRS